MLKVLGLVTVVTIMLVLGSGGPNIYAQIPTVQLTESEIDEFGKDSNGDKLDYNDCPNYDDGIDPSEYDGMTLDELGAITDNVDLRILELVASANISENEKEELDCLQAIRAIENEAEAKISGKVSGFIEDLEEISDLYSDQQSVNERFESLQEKYGE